MAMRMYLFKQLQQLLWTHQRTQQNGYYMLFMVLRVLQVRRALQVRQVLQVLQVAQVRR